MALSSWSSLSQIGYFETGDFPQLNVHQNQVGAALAGEIERPDAVARADGMVAARRVTFFGPVHSQHQDAPAGAGSQLLSLSAPGVFFWTQNVD
jgi:hypothetical protein